MFITRRATTVLAVCTFLLSAVSAHAQSYPSRPVRLVLPFGAGGSADVVARTIAQKLSDKWSQQVVVDNKPGGDTVIATAEMQRAAPDGYTLLLGINSTPTLTPHTMKVSYDPQTDFTIIGQTTAVPMLILVNETVPVKSLVQSGKLKALGVSTPTRLKSLPDVPTLMEQGIRDQRITLSHVMTGPRGLPKPIVDKLKADLQEVLALPDLNDKLTGVGIQAAWVDGDILVKSFQTESAVTAALVKELGLQQP